MYSDKVEVLRFETEPYRKYLDQDVVRPKRNGMLRYNNNNNINNNNINNNDDDEPKHKFIYHNGYHNTLVETETKSSSSSSSTATTVTAAAAALSSTNGHHHSVQPPSDPLIASVLHHYRHNPRPGRLLLENVNSRPQTMDRGTQADADNVVVTAEPRAIDKAPSTVANDGPTDSQPTNNEPINNEPTNNELFRNANISVTNQKLLNNGGGDNSSVDSLHSADSAKRDNEEPVIELAEIRQPMIAKDEGDGNVNMSNGDGKHPGVGGKPSNGDAKVRPVDDDIDRPSCGMECLYFAMQCCECSIM